MDMSKMLLNFFNILFELNSSENNQINDDLSNLDDDITERQNKILTKCMVDKALKQTESVPSHQLIQTMIMEKTKHTHTYLMSNRVY